MSVLSARSDVPVILVTGYGQDETAHGAIEAGAADYIVKPFSPTEVVARTKAALHQHTAPDPADTREPFSVGELTIDYAARTVTVAGRPAGAALTHRTPTAVRAVAQRRPSPQPRPADAPSVAVKLARGPRNRPQRHQETPPQTRRQRHRTIK